MKKIKSISALALALIGTILLTACGQSGVEVSSFFDNDQAIEEGTAVFFKGELVGEVIDVDKEGLASTIMMVIDSDQAELVSKQAVVVVNSLKIGKPLEIHNSANPKALGLEDGDQLKGLDSMMSLIGWSVGDALDFGGNELSGYLKSFQDYLKSDQFQDDKAAVQSQVTKAADEAVAALKSVDDEIRATVNEHQLTEQELADAMEQLGVELSPVIEDIASSSAEVMRELERFAQSLEASSEEHKDSGEKFLESLEAMLEKLNESMEKGLQEGNSEDATP